MKNLILSSLILLFSLCAHAQIITTIAGGGLTLGDGGPATIARLAHPTDITTDTAGNIFIADGSYNRIRKVDLLGIITTIAGTGDADDYNGDGIAATAAKLAYPSAITVDVAGNIYFCDDHNYRIRKINTVGIITTIAGTGAAGYNGDNIAATTAQVEACAGIAVDGSGNVFITDILNHRIRKINTAGIISTIAGTGVAGYSGDGNLAINAAINQPFDVTLDIYGNIYFTEFSNNCIRKINTAGIVTTIAGTGTGGYNGDEIPATAAQLKWPDGVKVDAYGNVYFADVYNNRVRKINAAGIIYTIAGTGGGGYNGDNGPATSATLNRPIGTAIGKTGDLYIADINNDRIRAIKNIVTAASINIRDQFDIHIYPNPSYDGRFTLKVTASSSEQAKVLVTNIAGRRIKDFIVNTNDVNNIQIDEPLGIYILSIANKHSVISTKISILK